MADWQDQDNLYLDLKRSLLEHSNLVAVVDGNAEYTYRELYARACTAAHAINGCGVTPGELVPVVTNGGIGMVSSMIGCLQVGAAFVVIDAGGPKARISEMLDDIAPRVVVLDDGAVLPEGRTEPVIPANRSNHPEFDKHVERCGEDLAYGLFTSGSTGKPKCCLNTHAGLTNRFRFNSSVKRLAPGNAVLQNSKHTFDPVLWQTLWPLTKGGRVIIPERQGLMDIDVTIQSIHDYKVVMTDMVPSVLSVLLRYLKSHPGHAQRLRSLEHIFVGGEEVSANVVNECSATLPWVQLTNTYGPTEAAIGMVYYPFKGPQEEPIPLGYAIPGTKYMVVDDHATPLADGETGQIVIAGKCLGRGYLNQPEKTASAFKVIRDRAGVEERYYFTGDRGAVHDGKLFFYGRKDKLVKINGVRIELKEVEVNIEKIDGVRQCRATTQKGHSGKNSVVAFVVLDRAVAAQHIKSVLRQRLPAEFIPSEVILLDEFPRNSVGKIDQPALDAMLVDNARQRGGRSNSVLADILSKYVAVEALSDDDNLFDHGLDSLNSVLLSIDIAERFNVRLSPPDIFKNPTIREIEGKISAPTPIGRHVSSWNDESARKLTKWATYEFRPEPKKRKVLLTGATGYVGIHLLRVLSQRDDVEVVSLVRARSEGEGLGRLRNAALSQRIADEINWRNVTPICGDLSQPGVGVVEATWSRIAPAITEIFHVGADVNFYKTFEDLEDANVKATAFLADEALLYNHRHFHYISTTGVLAALPNAGQDTGEICPTRIQHVPDDGYSLTKLAGELVSRRLSQKGIPVSIYRLGEVMPSPDYPVLNPKAVISSLLETFIELGCVFDTPQGVHYSPIDHIANLFAAPTSAARDAAHLLDIFNLSHPSLVDFPMIGQAMNDAGIGVHVVKDHEFLSKLSGQSAAAHWSRHKLIAYDYVQQLQGPEASALADGTKQPTHSKDWPAVDVPYLARVFRNMQSHRKQEALAS